jgi:hypothetical protein
LPLWGSCSLLRGPGPGPGPGPCVVHRCCPLHGLSVSALCRHLLVPATHPASSCLLVACAGSSVVVMVLASFASSLFSYLSPTPVPTICRCILSPIPSPAISRPRYPFLSVVALLSILRAGAHSHGTGWGVAIIEVFTLPHLS